MKPSSVPSPHQFARKEELINSLTHGAGIVLSVFGFGALLSVSILRGDAWSIVAANVYGIALVLLYTTSTLYHALQSPIVKHRLRILDYCAIFVFIAGTYTPFMLISLRASLWGSILLGSIWLLAVLGIVLKPFFTGRYKSLSTFMYIVMGWLVVIAAKQMIDSVPRPDLYWLAAGGIVYSIGAIFYAWKNIPYNHSLWHVFVLVGSICHYIAICGYVIAD
jgi:hemolysin III